MSRTFDYGGRVVSASHPVKALKTVKKTLLIDSADRDTTKYYTNGDFVVYLPRVYENVVSMRLVAAEFPPLVTITPTTSSNITGTTQTVPSSGIFTVTVVSTTGFNPGNAVLIASSGITALNAVYTILTVPSSTTFTVLTALTGSQTTTGGTATIQTPGARTHQFTYGQTNLASTTFSNDTVVPAGTYYFLLDVEGMNKGDELAVGGNKSTFVDSYFAKIPALSGAYNSGTFIEYNDHAQQENIAHYSPAIGKLDRLHIRTRLHNQKDSNIGVLYWSGDGSYAATGNRNVDYSLTLEIEYLDNVFDDFSSLETHLTSRT